MRCGLCGFLIIKPQTALHHAVRCGAVQYYLQCGAVMPFCRQFWCDFCGLCSLCGLVNTPMYEPAYFCCHSFNWGNDPSSLSFCVGARRFLPSFACHLFHSQLMHPLRLCTFVL